MDRRVGVKSTGKSLQAGHDDFLLSRISCDQGNAASTLTIDTEVLCERLEKHDVVGVLSKESQRVGILFEVTRCEALVSRVESAEVTLGFADVEDVLPLLGGGVNTSGVVSANVQENNRVVLGVLKVLTEAIEVETLGLGVIVAVGLPFLANNFDKTSVEGPSGAGHQDVDVFVGIPVREELETKTERASSRDTLAGSDATFLNLLVVSTIGKSEALGDVGVNTLNASVLVVHIKFQNLLFCLADTVEDERLSLVTTVDTHTEELLLGVRVLLEGFVKTKDGVSRGSGDTGPDGELAGSNSNLLVTDSARKHSLFV